MFDNIEAVIRSSATGSDSLKNKRGGKVKLQSILMPLSEFENAEKGNALYAEHSSGIDEAKYYEGGDWDHGHGEHGHDGEDGHGGEHGPDGEDGHGGEHGPDGEDGHGGEYGHDGGYEGGHGGPP
ncbi:hypothetical protein Vadar_002196 [Vaccinium darrowii]|uniref:Uncharacterized protein n=1 Tax=Vaccinium darrowii TaxID=229202 RepID=A0ACB7Z147_9ERIC|nr:hypothetical protein Vadar_002196 [Vaccinium darrowii]